MHIFFFSFTHEYLRLGGCMETNGTDWMVWYLYTYESALTRSTPFYKTSFVLSRAFNGTDKDGNWSFRAREGERKFFFLFPLMRCFLSFSFYSPFIGVGRGTSTKYTQRTEIWEISRVGGDDFAGTPFFYPLLFFLLFFLRLQIDGLFIFFFFLFRV